ncbi:hypothetical protein H7B90_07575, partial [Cohnella xylanilytica]
VGAAAGAAPAGSAATERRSAAGREQRVYIRIGAQREQPAVLASLKKLLASHPGPLPTLLFYERERRTVALSDELRVKPSPELTGSVERLLGEGSIRVK